MEKTDKEAIREAIEAFLQTQDMTQNTLADRSGVNALYIKGMRDGSHSYTLKGADTPIPDKWYYKLAEYIGYKVQKTYWEPKPTDQFMRILATLEDARKFGYTNVIIGETGSGKSYVCDLFQKKYRQDVFIIKMGKSDNVGDVLDKTVDALQIPDNKHEKVKGNGHTRSKSLRIKKIINFLKKLKLDGYNPTVIWDESEYMNLATLCAIKEFYDELRQVSALILIGTDQLLENIVSLSAGNKSGMPQFYSRIKFGIRELKAIDRRFPIFLEDVEDKEVRDFIKANCSNYREVHDILVPASREADRLDVPLTVSLIHNVLGIA
jgi:DNA transposition AAA+ family ATPase